MLGIPWLQVHNSLISWSDCEITTCSLYCKLTCFQWPQLYIASTTIDNPEINTPVHIHAEFMDVFSKANASELPPHCSYDCHQTTIWNHTTMLPNLSTIMSQAPDHGQIYKDKGGSSTRIYCALHLSRFRMVHLHREERQWSTSQYWQPWSKWDHEKVSVSSTPGPGSTGAANFSKLTLWHTYILAYQ